MSAHHHLSEMLARYHALPLDAEVKSGFGNLNSDAAEALLADFKHAGEVTDYQKKEISAGRAESLVDGSYVIRERIASGAQADVFKAFDVGLHRFAALKIIRRDLLRRLSSEAFERNMQRFEQGARAAARLNHPNVVQTYNYNPQRHCLAEEYIEGRDLNARINLVGKLELDDALDIVLQAARGLAYAHSCGVLHRDMKPSNLILDEKTGQIKITDWGMARIGHNGETPAFAQTTRISESGDVFGSVCFISPEQAEDSSQAEARSDMYSLGCTLFTLLTGRPIYQPYGDHSTATVTMLAHGDWRYPVPSLVKECGAPEELDRVFQRMAAKRREDRFETMNEVVARLGECRSRLAKTVTKPQHAPEVLQEQVLTP